MAVHFFARVAVHFLRAPVPSDDPAVQVLTDDRVLRTLGDRSKPLCSFFSPLSFRDVTRGDKFCIDAVKPQAMSHNLDVNDGPTLYPMPSGGALVKSFTRLS